jgi:hypothetical protein
MIFKEMQLYGIKESFHDQCQLEDFDKTEEAKKTDKNNISEDLIDAPGFYSSPCFLSEFEDEKDI